MNADIEDLLRTVPRMMRGCGSDQRTEARQYNVRRTLQAGGLGSYVDQGPPVRYHFALSEPAEVVVRGVDFRAAVRETVGVDFPYSYDVAEMTLRVSGFILAPELDWALVGYLVVS